MQLGFAQTQTVSKPDNTTSPCNYRERTKVSVCLSLYREKERGEAGLWYTPAIKSTWKAGAEDQKFNVVKFMPRLQTSLKPFFFLKTNHFKIVWGGERRPINKSLTTSFCLKGWKPYYRCLQFLILYALWDTYKECANISNYEMLLNFQIQNTPGMVAQAFIIPALGRQRQNCCEFEAYLFCIVHFRAARTRERDPVWKSKNVCSTSAYGFFFVCCLR